MPSETVKVMVRVRPMNQREKGKNCLPCIEIDDKQNQITLVKAGNNGQKSFTYDYVFGQNISQQVIYEQTAFPLVENVVEGYNGTIFAYGQTGCGKTHTMIGEPSNDIHKGIIPRTFDHIINVIQTADQIDRKYLVRCAYIEIYNEEIHDLLGKDVKAKMEMKESPEHGLFIKDLTIQVVKSVEEMDRYMAIGTNSRSVGETAMNKDSSRSHCIFTIYIECSVTDEKGNSRITAGKLNLVDLAGSERQSKTQATGDRLKEATKINLSLSALGNVISALVDGKTQHIPYRDSKLTRLLQDSLGGNTKTIMIAAVSPADDNYDETQSTLRYASRAKQIKNQPKVNEDPKDAQLREYAEEIKRLKELLLKQNATPTPEVPLSLNLGQIQNQKPNDIMSKSKVLDMQKENQDLQKQKDKLEQEMQQRDEQVKKEREEREKLQKLIQEKEQQFLSGGRADDEEKKKFRQLQVKIRSQKKDHDKLVEESQRKQEELLKMEKNYKSINEEVEQLRSLVTYLRKKYQEALNENRDLEKEQEESKEDLLETIRAQEKELKQIQAILKMMLSNDEIDAIRGASTWVEENKEYIVPPFSFKNKKVYFPKLSGQQALEFIDQEKQNRELIFDGDNVGDFYENEFRSSGQHFRIKSNGQANLNTNNSNQNINNKIPNNAQKKGILNEQTMQMIKIRESYDKEKFKSHSTGNPPPPEKRVLHAQLQPISQDEFPYSPVQQGKSSIMQNNSQLAGNSVFVVDTNAPDTGSKPNKGIQLQPIHDKPPMVPRGESIFYDGPPVDNLKKPNRMQKLDKLS